ncbi:hypothetical protein IJJ53_00045 [Candidatus Saccharibacteria bacterium]|nr:hypothetical protein [Candidatus Saccharibacteria bacterium]
MGKLEEMLLRNGLILNMPGKGTFRIENSSIYNRLVAYDSSGNAAYKIVPAANGVDILVEDYHTGKVEMRLAA